MIKDIRYNNITNRIDDYIPFSLEISTNKIGNYDLRNYTNQINHYFPDRLKSEISFSLEG